MKFIILICLESVNKFNEVGKVYEEVMVWL